VLIQYEWQLDHLRRGDLLAVPDPHHQGVKTSAPAWSRSVASWREIIASEDRLDFRDGESAVADSAEVLALDVSKVW
jgi:hypothetical protein